LRTLSDVEAPRERSEKAPHPAPPPFHTRSRFLRGAITFEHVQRSKGAYKKSMEVRNPSTFPPTLSRFPLKIQTTFLFKDFSTSSPMRQLDMTDSSSTSLHKVGTHHLILNGIEASLSMSTLSIHPPESIRGSRKGNDHTDFLVEVCF